MIGQAQFSFIGSLVVGHTITISWFLISLVLGGNKVIKIVAGNLGVIFDKEYKL